jgi:hypothetical protein
VELAKSGRAECKRCDSFIANKSVRVGVLIDGEWGLFTRWQHLDCTGEWGSKSRGKSKDSTSIE